MTNNNKQEKAPKDVKLLKEPIDKISDEKASPSVTNFKSKFWRYGLLTFIIVLSFRVIYRCYLFQLDNPYAKTLEFYPQVDCLKSLTDLLAVIPIACGRFYTSLLSILLLTAMLSYWISLTELWLYGAITRNAFAIGVYILTAVLIAYAATARPVKED